ncbi:acyl-CoA N-acyltransferase [Sarocladium strictum]
MSISLREATLEDVEAICDVYLSAFSEETVSLQTLPRESGTGRAFWKAATIEDIKSHKTHVLVITDDADSDKIIAYGKWKPPGVPIEDPPSAEHWPQDGNSELGPRFFGRFAALHREIMQGREHWYLELVVTHKAAGGRGAARKLMEWGLERADRDGLPTFLEATREGEPIYEKKFGFKVVRREKIDVDTEIIDAPFMVREPKPAS